MKRSLIYFVGILALVAGCSKESVITVINEPSAQKTIIKAVADPMTKTTIDIVGTQGVYAWEADEEIAVYNGEKALTFVSEDADDGTFSYTGSEPTTTLNYGISPASAYTAIDGSNYQLELKSSYTGYKSNVSNAIMVAGTPVTVGSYKKFTFKHAAALIRFTYENVPTGTTGLRFSTSDKKINGIYTVTGTTPELTQANANGSTSTTLNLSSAVSSANTTIVFYVPIPTGDYKDFTVTLFNGEGDIAETTKQMTSATKLFTAEKGSIINTPVITLNHIGSSLYQRINNTKDLADGLYLIVYEDGSLVFDSSLDPLDVSSNNQSVTITDHTIPSNVTTDGYAFTLNKTNGSLKSASGYYIGRTTDANGMLTDESIEYTNSISFDGNNVTIVSSGGAYFRYNSTSGQERFRYFKSSTYTSQKAIQLYKRISEATLPQLSMPQALIVDASTKHVSWHAVANADSYTVTIDGTSHSGITNTYFDSDIADGYYDVSVQAISDDHSVRYDSAVATLEKQKFGDPIGESYSYTFTINPFDDYDGRASDTETTETSTLGAYHWDLTATYIKVNTSPYLQLTTGSRTDNATFSNTDYDQDINKIVLVVKTNNSKSVTVNASVDGVSFTCDKSNTVSSTSDVTLTFTSAVRKKGEILFEFTSATGGYYIKSFSINPD